MKHQSGAIKNKVLKQQFLTRETRGKSIDSKQRKPLFCTYEKINKILSVKAKYAEVETQILLQICCIISKAMQSINKIP